jgi:hypothetical protein
MRAELILNDSGRKKLNIGEISLECIQYVCRSAHMSACKVQLCCVENEQHVLVRLFVNAKSAVGGMKQYVRFYVVCRDVGGSKFTYIQCI